MGEEDGGVGWGVTLMWTTWRFCVPESGKGSKSQCYCLEQGINMFHTIRFWGWAHFVFCPDQHSGCDKTPVCLPRASEFLCWASRSPWQLAQWARKIHIQ